MRLYPYFESLQGLFIVAHRNYISVYDLTAIGDDREKNLADQTQEENKSSEELQRQQSCKSESEGAFKNCKGKWI